MNQSQSELNDSMQHFLQMLKDEYEIYEKVYKKAVEQRDAIEKMDIREINQVISEKQVLLNRIAEMEKGIKDLRDVWVEAKQIIDPKLSKEISEFSQKFFKSMEKLIEYEAQSEKLFVTKNEIREEELAHIRKSKQIAQAYSQQTHRKAEKTDIEG